MPSLIPRPSRVCRLQYEIIRTASDKHAKAWNAASPRPVVDYVW